MDDVLDTHGHHGHSHGHVYPDDSLESHHMQMMQDLDDDVEQEGVEEEDDVEEDVEDIPPEVPKRTSSKGVGSVPLASSTSASGRSSAGSMSIRGQVKSCGNGVANNESRQPRICSATGRPLVVS